MRGTLLRCSSRALWLGVAMGGHTPTLVAVVV